MDCLGIIDCIKGARKDEPHLLEKPAHGIIIDETAPVERMTMFAPIVKTTEAMAADVVGLLVQTNKRAVQVRAQVDEIVAATGWTEQLARSILGKLEAVVEQGREQMGPTLLKAYNKAVCLAVEHFDGLVRAAKDQPYETAAAVLLTVLAVGVLAQLAPVVLELLGFGELGPIEGSFAAWWEAAYAGYVPRGSLFSFLQRLGMRYGSSAFY
ncbi:hypothetical protein HIM_05782 [Hirsutella minnesotensis 3608]|uniref:Uncharacterized protein n=1 Tax=Hirsutella minnesotensis 3608 TaxID=1043627 RepID=A0A0F7ZUH5_9HYPO|nr:hypothetical protein HIM_05782 [Hirsutella minnesotensis 3608]